MRASDLPPMEVRVGPATPVPLRLVLRRRDSMPTNDTPAQPPFLRAYHIKASLGKVGNCFATDIGLTCDHRTGGTSTIYYRSTLIRVNGALRKLSFRIHV